MIRHRLTDEQWDMISDLFPGLKPVPNSVGGVFMSTRPGGIGTVVDNIIGGTDGAHATRNIISGNLSSGVFLVGDRVSNNSVVGNFIG